MAKYDNIGVDGKNPYNKTAAEIEEEAKKKREEAAKKKAEKEAKKKARLEEIEAADKAMQEAVDKEYEENKEVERQALQNNGSSEEIRDRNKAIQEDRKIPVDETVINDVIAGKYGTGAARKQKLLEAGYDPNEVQSAVNEAVEKQKAETEKTEPEVEEKTAPTNLTESLSGQGIPDKTVEDLVESDEGQEADGAIADNNPAGLQNITSPDGQGILKGYYDENGYYVPHVYTVEDTRLVKNKGWAAALTILSAAISVLGVAAGVPVMPIDFFQLGASSDEDLARMNKVEDDYARVMNAGIEKSNEIERTEDAKTKAYESNAQAAIDKPELYESEIQNKVAGSAAALSGGNTQLQTQESAQEFQAAQNEFDRQFQKEMAKINNDSAMALLKQQGINAQTLLKLQADENAMTDLKRITAMKNAGMSEDEAARWIRSFGGMTALQTYLGPLMNGAGQAAGILTGIFAGKSDKGIKKFVYDGKAANSKMLSSKRKFW